MTFVAGKSGNPAGRPKGIGPIKRAALLAAYNRNIAPYSEELMQRGVERALQGDTQALGGLLTLIAATMTTSTSSAQQGQQGQR